MPIKIYVIYDELYECPIGVVSTEDKAQEVILELMKKDGYHFNYDDFEIDNGLEDFIVNYKRNRFE